MNKASFCYVFAVMLFLANAVFATEPAGAKHSPYGVCAHLAGGPEHDAMPKNLELMRQANIRWIRCDFSAWDVEGPEGTWKFEHIDRLLDQCDKYGIKVLPILNHPHSYASPTYEKTEEWLIYVEKIVSRYKNRIRYWEVWNEPNLHGFGDGKVQGKNYAKTLIATYKKIKEIDPELTVLYAGLAHIPLDFVEQSFEAGCVEFFDIMNVHPYRRGFTSMGELEKYEAEVVKLRVLMKKNGVGDKPIWFTEMGWPTPTETFYVSRGILSATKKILAPEKKAWKIAVLTDDNYPSSTAASFDALKGICPEGYEPVEIKLTDLVGIDPKRFDALIFPPSENYPSPYHDDIQNYVASGGTLFLLGGVPMYRSS